MARRAALGAGQALVRGRPGCEAAPGAGQPLVRDRPWCGAGPGVGQPLVQGGQSGSGGYLIMNLAG